MEQGLMMPYLEIQYLSYKWVHALRAEIAGRPALAAADLNWGSSGLSDLAFSLETRLGNLVEIVALVDESLKALDAEFYEERDHISVLLARKVSYRVKNKAALRRVIIGLNSFVIEAREIFENLARFCQRFLHNYFDEHVSLKQAYAKVAETVPDPDWGKDLRLLRHDIVHKRSPWIRFAVRSTAPKYDAVLLMDYRIMSEASKGDEVSLEALRNMRRRLLAAADEIRSELIERVRRC